MKISTYFLTFILLLMVAVVGVSLTFPRIETKLLPILLGSVVFVLAGIQLWKEIMTKGKVETAVKEAQLPKPRVKASSMSRRFGSTLGWILGFFLGIYLLGFVIAIPLFVLSYLKWYRRRWRTAVTFAAVITVLVYAIFELSLQVDLYDGLVFHLMGA